MKIKQKKVTDIWELIVKEPTTISADATVSDLFSKMVEDHKTRHVYVTDKNKQIVGSVRLNDLIEFMLCYLSGSNDDSFNTFIAKYSKKKVSQIMLKQFVCLKMETGIQDMISTMLVNRVSELPVVDENRKIVGEANLLEFIKFLADSQSLIKNNAVKNEDH
ncbi:MAG: CBS domain-containing protein [Candidatus Omnitrophica bacterium]|nr:CBS domain-containing protein [Candidatus Omnitrophota bacterium]